jgi:hypothetical protein
MRYFISLLLLLFFTACSSSRQASRVVHQDVQPGRIADSEQLMLSGVITDESGEPIIFGSVAAYDNDMLLAGTETGFDGEYQLQLEELPQDLIIEFSYVGMKTTRYQIGRLQTGQYRLNGTMPSGPPSGFDCGAYHYKVPLIEIDNTTSGATFTSDQLQRMPAFRGGSN